MLDDFTTRHEMWTGCSWSVDHLGLVLYSPIGFSIIGFSSLELVRRLQSSRSAGFAGDALAASQDVACGKLSTLVSTSLPCIHHPLFPASTGRLRSSRCPLSSLPSIHHWIEKLPYLLQPQTETRSGEYQNEFLHFLGLFPVASCLCCLIFHLLVHQ